MKGLLKALIRLYYRLFFRVRVEGLERVPEGACVLAPNHISQHDPVIIGAFFPEFVRFMAKKELFDVPVIKQLIAYAGAFPVDRDANDIRAVKTALKVLKEDKKLMMFPEGTRNYTTTPLEGKSGVIVIASRAKVPVVPVTVDSTYRLFSPVRIHFHDPLPMPEGRLSTEEAGEIVKEMLLDIYGDMQYYKGR